MTARQIWPENEPSWPDWVTPEFVYSQVKILRERVENNKPGDPEDWHVAEDWILVHSLKAISEGRIGEGMASAVAQEAMKVRELKYTKWYA